MRWHALALLRSLHRDDPQPRERRVAELLWRYVEAMEKQANRGADPRLAEFLAIQRWVALAFLEPASAAHAFAEALRQAGEAPQTSPLLRLGGVTSAIELPLANEQELLAYARGLDALVSGDDERARTLLRALGDNEIRVGDVVLRSPASWLERSPAAAEVATEEGGGSARRKLCLLVAGSAQVPALGAMIGEALATFEMDVVGSDGLRSGEPADRTLYERLLAADLVVCDLSRSQPEDFYLLGVCWALRPSATLPIAERGSGGESPWLRGRCLDYWSPHDGQRGAGYVDFVRRMQRIVEQSDAGYLGSPVYAQYPLAAPRLAPDERPQPATAAATAGGAQPRCLVVQGFGQRRDAGTGRTLDLDASFAVVREAVESAGCRCLRAEGGGGLDEALLRALHEVDVVVADLSASVVEVLLQVGIRFALRPRRTLLVAEEQWPVPRAFAGLPMIRYRHLGEDVGSVEASRLRAGLGAAITASLAGTTIDSPVYRALPDLQPPRRAGEPQGDGDSSRLPEWASDGGSDEYGRWASLRVGEATQRFRWIAPGRFLMGSPEDEPGRGDDEVQHAVTLTQGYWLADTACAQALWQAVMGNNPSEFQDDPRNPVEQVSWNDVQEFLTKLNQRVPGLEARLPSEAEWEYACRAGTTTPFSFGANITPEQVNYDGNYPYAGAEKGRYRRKTVPVATLPANPWGLYEMHGNVWEWCADWYGAYPGKPQVDPRGAETGGARVLRGGSWLNFGRNVRSSLRFRLVPADRDLYVGFRLAPGLGRAAEPTASVGKGSPAEPASGLTAGAERSPSPPLPPGTGGNGDARGGTPRAARKK